MVSGRHAQLSFSLLEANEDANRLQSPRGTERTSPPFSARREVCGKGLRVRTLPSRDSRGRFVAVATSEAPSWYVFCAGSYCIPGEPMHATVMLTTPVIRQPLPRAIVHRASRSRHRFSRFDLMTYVLLALGYFALLWYGLHLPRPSR